MRNFIKNIQEKGMLFGIVMTSLVIFSCSDSLVDQIAVERTVITNIQIKTTTELPLLIGKDSLLTVVYAPESPSNSKLEWSSSDESIAKVSQEGRVSAMALGAAKITVKSTDGSARASSIDVRVINSIDYITGITLTSASAQLFENETLLLNAAIAPLNATYKTLKWTSSDNSVAVVSETGDVTGVKEGTVTITASATDGSGKKGTILLTVKKVIPLTGIAISTVINETLAIDQLLPIEVTLAPSNATAQSLVWSSDNPAIASVSNTGIVKGMGDGRATITVSAKNDSNIKATITVVVEAGKINDTFLVSNSVWKVATANSSSVISDGLFKATMAVQSVGPPIKYRADFQRNGGAILHAGNYPIIAFKFNRPIGAGNIVFDTNNGSYLNGNNKLTTLTAKDGIQVHYADLSTGTFGPSAVKLSTLTATTLTVFQLKIADFVLADGDNHYEVYWVKSFKTVADLQAYINQ
ncbi:Ig domain protein group 2 domain protein [Pseudopedobacter saltans DSM 12145]|uniref:Ig domain protein group 2 domain protein n=1 Tax=Pseudopedobacter saltans (strain ATCC 51119 / DSM 12145 / JCM 21818 / CCUG 39354 / LMG 10337 / NBRC 100064 / NCIMB 13643) TaxID=762903 RepID=F0S6F5_PSESL|nr:DUF4979 domain-containing protein [Pseudopedobacter saltans]ADY54281.1 Ig domain protein group 2 domain protein [Pseudopedobacter saltans DSM 12145]